MKLRIYYAHPVSTYNTQQERLDMATLECMGFEVINPNQPHIIDAYTEKGMEVFYSLVRWCDLLAFRSFSDGMIGAGVAGEIEVARESGMPIIELEPFTPNRELTIEETRNRLKEST